MFLNKRYPLEPQRILALSLMTGVDFFFTRFACFAGRPGFLGNAVNRGVLVTVGIAAVCVYTPESCRSGGRLRSLNLPGY
jgi:hypothetical protein